MKGLVGTKGEEQDKDNGKLGFLQEAQGLAST